MECSSFETSNQDEALDHARRAFHPRFDLVRTSGPFHLRHERVDHGTWTSDAACMTAGGLRVEPYGVVSVCRIRSGRVRLDTGRDTLALQQGDVVVLTDGATPGSFTSADAQTTEVRLSLDAFDRVAQDLPEPPGPRRRLTFPTRRPVTAGAARRLTRAVGFAERHLGDGGTDPDGVLSRAVGDLIAAAVLTAFPNTLTAGSSVLRPRADVPTTVALALDFVTRNADLPIGPVDIAAHVSVSRRALEMAFREHLATSPAAYLRRHRLARVHEELLAAEPGDGSSVTEVAGRWGFTRSSRFATYYREVYGEPPSATLRHAG